MYNIIKEFEGFRSEAYKCPAGKWTIGYGSTMYEDGTKVKEGDIINEADAERLLEHYCRNRIKLPKGMWSVRQEEALCSLIYNIGQGAFDRSKLKKALEDQDWYTAYHNWDWTRANGRILPGLVRRRNREREQFFRDVNSVALT
jgi:lysozyme